MNWLASILGEILKYPSVDLADRHRKANKLGSLDAKTPEQIAKELEDEMSSDDENDNESIDKNNQLRTSNPNRD